MHIFLKILAVNFGNYYQFMLQYIRTYVLFKVIKSELTK